MDTMSDCETYNGYANRETWAFNLHWQNDQGLYNETLEQARDLMTRMNVARVHDEPLTDYELGEYVVDYWIDTFETIVEDDAPMPATLRMFHDEVGSFWRVNRKEVGAAVRESLDIESSD